MEITVNIIYMLKLNSLHLEHFMCITEADLNFNASSIIIEGENGQGKSAVMEAIALCLSEKKRSDALREYVQKGADIAFIILDLTYNNEPIHIEFKMNTKGWTSKDCLYKNKHYLNSEVGNLIKDLELTFYSDIILQMQGQDDITTMTPTQRSNMLQQLFQFDFSEQVNSIEKKIDEVSQNKTVNLEKIDFLEKVNKKKEESLQSLIEKDFEFSKEDYDNYKKELEDNRLKLESSNDALLKYNELLRENSFIESEIRRIESLKESALLKIEAINKTKSDLKNLDYDSKSASFIQRESELRSEIDFLEKDFIDKEAKIADLIKQRSDISQKIGVAEASESLYIKKLDLITKGICPECGQSTHALHSEQIIKDKENNDLLLSSLEEEIKENNLCQLNLNKEVKLKQAEANQKRIDLNTVINEKKNLDNKKQTLEQNLSTQNIDELESAVKNYESEITKKQSQLNNLQDNIDTYSNLSAEINSIKAAINNLQNKVSSADSIHQYNKLIQVQKLSIKNNILENENIINDLKSSLSRYDLEIQTYNEVIKVLSKELPNYLVIKTCARLEKEMNDFVSVVFPSFRLRLLRSRKGVEFFYTTDLNADMNDIKTLINSKMASGYERSVLGLAFKVALCKAYNLSFIALDEIDAAASENNSALTMESLISTNIFNQIFFITHKPNTRDVIKSLCDSTIVYHVEAGVFTDEEAD